MKNSEKSKREKKISYLSRNLKSGSTVRTHIGIQIRGSEHYILSYTLTGLVPIRLASEFSVFRKDKKWKLLFFEESYSNKST
jgi:hypothetical protein